MNKLNNQKGFSLVELMIVIVIIGVLAAVAVPIYTSNVTKAKMSEANAALGTIRTMLRVYYGEFGEYPNPIVDAAVVDPLTTWNDIKAGELDGKYFFDADFTYDSADGISYTIKCAKGDILDFDRTLDQAGTFAGGV